MADSLRVLGLLSVAAWGTSILGTLGLAPWRRFAYPLLFIAIGAHQNV